MRLDGTHTELHSRSEAGKLHYTFWSFKLHQGALNTQVL